MESIVFCKISSMKYYKGAGPHDQPYNGGSFVKENGYGHRAIAYEKQGKREKTAHIEQTTEKGAAIYGADNTGNI